MHQRALVGLVVEHFLHSKVLAEGIVGEKDIVPGQVGGHGVRPVQHLHFHKDKMLAVPNVQGIAGFHHVEVPSALAVLPFQALHAIFGAVNGRAGNFVHQGGQRAGVILLAMVGNDEVDFVQIDFPFEVFHKFRTMWRPHRVDQNGLFLFDEVCVLAGAVHDGIIVTMEVFEFPVDIADPADIAFNVLSHNIRLQITIAPIPRRSAHRTSPSASA